MKYSSQLLIFLLIFNIPVIVFEKAKANISKMKADVETTPNKLKAYK